MAEGLGSERPYHKYVFDAESRQFVGEFEEMYQAEDKEQYDSWFQDDLTDLIRHLSLAVLANYNFQRILDVGCGKGAFTHLLKKVNNTVTGIDLSPTAIQKAKARYPQIQFQTLAAGELDTMGQSFDLVVVSEVLSYLSGWRDTLETIASMTQYIYATLYLPPDPAGYVASLDELRVEISRSFAIETELLLDREQLCILGKVKG